MMKPVENGRKAINKSGEIIFIDNYTKEEHIGANGVHESVHATDSQSRGFQNPTLSSDLIEKKPRAMELRYYKELDKLKKR